MKMEDRDVEARHKKEAREAEGQGRALLKKAKGKARKEEAAAEALRLEYAMKARHREELQQLEEREERQEEEGGGGEAAAAQASLEKLSIAANAAGEGAADEKSAGSADSGETEADRARQKVEKARLKAKAKRDKKAAKEREREDRIAEERRSGGPDPRDVELEAIQQGIRALGLRVEEIKSDGHCLYRAVARQLCVTGRRPDLTEEAFEELRGVAARQLRGARGEYEAFLAEELEGESFDQYCDKVETSAEWGGQVELRALSDGLKLPIEVFSAAAPVLRLGEAYEQADAEPLKLSFHEHYFALGAHYNSVVPAP